MTETAPFGIDSRWFHQRPARHRLLVAYAHPDDESFGNAGTIIAASRRGVAVHYACATRGEAGTVAPEQLAGYADTAALRTSEMESAARALDLSSLHFLGYRDSGMQGAPENDHPDALFQAPLPEVTGKVVALIRLLQPQVVLTFGPYGGYGHPDHIAIHHATLAAFAQAADPAAFPEQRAAGLAPWQAQKLYYPTFGDRFLKTAIRVMRLMGRDPAKFGQNNDVDLVRAAREITPITATVNSRTLLKAKEAAWNSHASQQSGRGAFAWMPAFVRSRMQANEHFTRVEPPPRPGEPPETDLFAGID